MVTKEDVIPIIIVTVLLTITVISAGAALYWMTMMQQQAQEEKIDEMFMFDSEGEYQSLRDISNDCLYGTEEDSWHKYCCIERDGGLFWISGDINEGILAWKQKGNLTARFCLSKSFLEKIKIIGDVKARGKRW